MRSWLHASQRASMRNGLHRGAFRWQWRSFSTSCGSETKAMLEVWAWGKGDAGQLGAEDDRNHETPHLIARIDPPPNLHLAHMQGLSRHTPLSQLFPALDSILSYCHTDKDSVSQQDGSLLQHKTATDSTSPPASLGISCGLFHSALLVDGELWTWGKGEAGRLGLGSEHPKYTPTSNPYLEDVQNVALGGLHSAATTKDGFLYTWGFGGFGALGHGRYKAEFLPRRLLLSEDEDVRVTYVAGGGSHSAAISSSGDLYTWGRDEGEGRLGHGEDLVTDEGAFNVPLQAILMPEPVVSVSCGGFFTMALAAEGKVWNWGGNANYELGRGDNRSRCKPSIIPEIEGMHVVQIACGGYHSAILTAEGRVLTWGRGGDGQLGHGSWDNGRTPKVVEALAHLRVAYIACGSFSTAVITETGELYCWGKNKDHRLGFGGTMDSENVPRQVFFSREDRQLKKDAAVLAVALGARHGIAIALS
ncbi:hypothetical protein GOP47_0018633 [Adiantum capillus-veneris]|uniref:RCC1-like domain-containing protein n=1 Tax=Adiantum capillus-veneris TaxID=13818 RepID=A0A9D4Z8Z5_ADICA|nr:hypothetical protein GOP47_0018633 [Adiantum capillus-veneris]